MTGRGDGEHEPVPSHAWLLTPLVAVLGTTLGAAAGIGAQTNYEFGLGSCESDAALGCGLVAFLITGAVIMLAILASLVLGARSRKSARPGPASLRGLLIALPCLVLYVLATALSSLLLG